MFKNMVASTARRRKLRYNVAFQSATVTNSPDATILHHHPVAPNDDEVGHRLAHNHADYAWGSLAIWTASQRHVIGVSRFPICTGCLNECLDLNIGWVLKDDALP